MAPGKDKHDNQYTKNTYDLHSLHDAENMEVDSINYGGDNW
ncbi:hypothetical protein C5S29_13670 [ANME-1 cluster archaeon GoMg3.2]|nr:hypothetical protein [ANME-1 cluster archaeon GoMg3.2]